MSRHFWFVQPGLLLAAFAVCACSHGSGVPARQADGSYEISCKAPLTDCLHQAERSCRDEGYTVTAASDMHELLGAETGQSQVSVQKSEATFYCGKLPGGRERPMIELKREHPLESSKPASEAAPTPSSAPEAPPPPPPPRACVPGATQSCIGPGGCSGGQACASDGSHFEPCDCGNPPPRP